MKGLKKLWCTALVACSSLLMNAQSITNPILSGFYPDPSICRAGNDYYIVNSSFAYFPGLPIFHSKDLLNWELIGHAMDRSEQLNLEGAGVSRGLFAPAISYHQGTFYIVCTLVDKLGNFVITAKNPKGPWSNPVPLPQVNGIDPSLFFNEDGKAYIVYNSIPPDNKSLYDGHRTIRMMEFDKAALKVIGTEKIIVNGGVDISKKPVWIEGPHMLKKDGWYYLICAEGGTGFNHSEVVFRSKSAEGPYAPYVNNPILTQRNLDPTRKDPVTTTGHADFVEGPDGKWWAVFLGCRPYEGDYYNTGRETFMAPVEWKDGWPQFALGGETVQYKYPISASNNKQKERFNGNYKFRDEFFGGIPTVNRFCHLRSYNSMWYDGHLVPGYLTLFLQPATCQEKTSPAFLGFRQSHINGEASTAMHFSPKSDKEKAGMLIFQNENHFYFLCKSVWENKPVLELWKGPGKQHAGDAPVLLKRINLTKDNGKDLFLKIKATGSTYSCWFAEKKHRWKLVMDELDGKFLSTKDAGGFVGSIYALYATSNGQPTENAAMYDWFECISRDAVYSK
ncbi:MAG: glycoside hydrolase family 43 protein [Bacteroidetes bacterium]|nr:glycoside hydrolase family 43 protein [Bacteroidota bacterium]